MSLTALATLALTATLVAQQVTLPPEQSPLTENRAPIRVIPPPGKMTAPSPQVDRWFANVARKSGDAEIEMAKLALRRGHTDEVKAYARQMISEHLGLSRALAPELRRYPDPAPKTLAPGDALTYYRLEHVPDVDFDQTYVLAQVAGHLATLGAFQTEADDGADARLKNVVAEWMPTIQSHLQLAIDITKHIGGDSPLKTGAQ